MLKLKLALAFLLIALMVLPVLMVVRARLKRGQRGAD
jgi:hypothetical protein